MILKKSNDLFSFFFLLLFNLILSVNTLKFVVGNKRLHLHLHLYTYIHMHTVLRIRFHNECRCFWTIIQWFRLLVLMFLTMIMMLNVGLLYLARLKTFIFVFNFNVCLNKQTELLDFGSFTSILGDNGFACLLFFKIFFFYIFFLVLGFIVFGLKSCYTK